MSREGKRREDGTEGKISQQEIRKGSKGREVMKKNKNKTEKEKEMKECMG